MTAATPLEEGERRGRRPRSFLSSKRIVKAETGTDRGSRLKSRPFRVRFTLTLNERQSGINAHVASPGSRREYACPCDCASMCAQLPRLLRRLLFPLASGHRYYPVSAFHTPPSLALLFLSFLLKFAASSFLFHPPPMNSLQRPRPDLFRALTLDSSFQINV